MGDIVNLRMVRKRKARAEKEQTAEQNRALHGRSGSARELQRRNAGNAEKFIDGHRLSPTGPDKG